MRQYDIMISSRELPNIIVDLDDVVCNTSDVLEPIMNTFIADKEIYIPTSKWTTYNLYEIFPVTKAQVEQIIIENDVFNKVTPLLGVKHALKLMKMRGYNIFICTARGNFEDKTSTYNFFDKYDIPFDHILFTKYGQQKSEVYKKFATCYSYMFDDNISNIEDAINSECVIKPYIVTKPWNIGFQGLRVNSLIEFCETHNLTC